MKKRGLKSAAPGDRVRLTGYFLAATGQQVGDEGFKRWTVVACECGLCKNGGHVAVDEKHSDEYRAQWWGDLPEAERPLYRHVALGNLERIGAPPRACDQADDLEPIGRPFERRGQ